MISPPGSLFLLCCPFPGSTQMSRQLAAVLQEESQAVLSQVNRSVDSYLRSIQLSLFYGIDGFLQFLNGICDTGSTFYIIHLILSYG